jgi:hypothetical protein
MEPLRHPDVGGRSRLKLRRFQIMADGSGASGLLGVLLGAILVVFIGAAIFMLAGNAPSRGPSFTIQLPK